MLVLLKGVRPTARMINIIFTAQANVGSMWTQSGGYHCTEVYLDFELSHQSTRVCTHTYIRTDKLI